MRSISDDMPYLIVGLHVAALIALIVGAVFFTGCDTTGGEEAPDAAPIDAHVCKNVFDEACAAENGCGVEGHFCCKRFVLNNDTSHVSYSF